ncbi:MAG: FAD-dependent oxidoreductase, partial [Deltaproteobacteria bacterium]
MSPNAVVEELKQSIGEEWVSDNPCDLGCYAKDFTIVPGSIPDVVVLPKTTEDVQAIIKIAGKHQLPVIPLSTGFNHGGLAIPRRGGIVVDLRRMNEIVDIDDEGMTATI